MNDFFTIAMFPVSLFLLFVINCHRYTLHKQDHFFPLASNEGSSKWRSMSIAKGVGAECNHSLKGCHMIQ